MATTFDAVNNPLSPLGLTSLISGSSKENPANTGNRLEDEASDLGKREERFLSSNIDLTRELGDLMIRDAEGKNLLAIREKELQSEHDRERKRIRDKLGEEYYNSPDMQEFKKFADESADKMMFVPSETTIPLLGVVFATIGATGLLLGGLSKNNAKAALSAMNGMAEGFGKGKEDLYKQERQTFDANVKAMTQRMGILKAKLDVAREKMKYDAESADLEANAAFAEAGADFLKANKDKFGLQDSITKLETQIKQNDTWARLMATKRESAMKQLESQKFRSHESELTRSSNIAIQRMLELGRDERAEESRQAAAERQAENIKAAKERDEKNRQDAKERAAADRNMRAYIAQLGQQKVQPIGMADGQLLVMDGRGNISSKLLPKGAQLAGKLAEKGGTSLKPGVKLQEGYVAQNIFLSDITEMKNQLQDPDLQKLIKNYRPEAFFSEKSEYLDQLLSTNLPPKLNKFLTTVKDFRNNYYLDKSGKAVTAGEALRSYGVVPQPGDTAERMTQKFDGLEKRVKNQIAINQQLYGFPELKIPSGTSTGLVPNQSYGISAQESSGPKEGDEAPSKSGKPMVFKNGSWEYKQ